MKVLGYIRVSTDEQADKGISLAAQRAKIEAYRALYELELVAVIEDAGISGKTLKRKGLQQALSMLKKGKAEGLVVVKLDRLTRSVVDGGTLIANYFSEKAGFQLLSVTDHIDTRTAAGCLVLNVLLSVSQWERQAIGERTRDALRHKIACGERCGKVRFGYDLAPDGKTLTPNGPEQKAIKLMRQLRAEGKSLREIAAELNDRSISTKEGRPWIFTSVAGILARSA